MQSICWPYSSGFHAPSQAMTEGQELQGLFVLLKNKNYFIVLKNKNYFIVLVFVILWAFREDFVHIYFLNEYTFSLRLPFVTVLSHQKLNVSISLLNALFPIKVWLNVKTSCVFLFCCFFFALSGRKAHERTWALLEVLVHTWMICWGNV